MAGAERFILDVEIKFDKSEKNFNEFARRAQRAVQTANQAAAQAAGQAYQVPTTPGAIGKEVAQTGGAIRVAAAQQGLSEADLNRALAANVAQGRARVESATEGQSAAARKRAMETYDRNVQKHAQLSQVQVNEAVKQATAQRQSTTSAQTGATADAKTARAKSAQAISEQRAAELAAKQLADRARISAQKNALMADPAFQAARAEEQAANQRNRAAIAAAAAGRVANDPEVTRLRAQAEADKTRLAQQTRLARDAALANDPAFQRQVGLGQNARRSASAGLNPATGRAFDDVLAQRVATERAIATANDTRISTLRRAQLADDASVTATAQRTASERAYKGAVDRSMRAQILSGQIDVPGGKFQRLTAGLGYGGGGAGGGQGLGVSAGQFLGGGLLSTLKYSIPSLALFGAARGISEAIKEAQELDKIFAQLDSQYTAVFGEDGQQKAKAFQDEILGIARETGLAGETVASVGLQFAAAFRDQNIEVAPGEFLGGQALINKQLEDAAKASRVTGLTPDELTDPLTAASRGYSASVEQILNITSQLKNEFGVLDEEIIGFLGDIAPVAKEAGFSLEEIGTIAAITQQQSGRSGAELAEAYGRVIPAIAESTDELLQLAAANDQLNNQKFLEAVGNGDLKTIFFEIADNFESLNKDAQNFVINLLGGRREASSILAAFGDSDKISKVIKELDRDSDDLNKRFERVQETFSQTLARLGEQFRQLGTEIYNAGLADALNTVGDLLINLLRIISLVSGVFAKFNDMTGGVAAKLITLTGVVLGLSAAFRALGRSQTIQQLAANAGSIRAQPLQGPAIGGGVVAAPGLLGSGGVRSRAATVGGGLRTAGGASRVGTLPAALITTFGAMAVFDSWQGNDKKVANAADQLRDRMTKASKDDLEQIEKERYGIIESLGLKLFGEDTPAEMARLELGRREAGTAENAPQIAAAADEDIQKQLGDITKGQLDELNKYIQDNQDLFNDAYAYSAEELKDPKVIKEIQEAAEGGDSAAIRTLDILYGFAEGNKDIQSALNQARDDRSNRIGEAVSTAKADLETSGNSIEETKSLYESGDASLNDYLAAYDDYLAIAQAAFDASGGNNTKIAEQIAKRTQERGKIFSDAALQQESLTAEIEALSVSEPEANANQVQRLTGLLQNPQFSDPKARADTAKKIAGLYNSILQAQISDASTAAEAAEIASRGIDISPVVRIELMMAQLNQNNQAYQNFVTEYAAATGEDGAALVKQIMTAIANNDQSLLGILRQDTIAKVNVLNSSIRQTELFLANPGDADPKALEAKLKSLVDARNVLFGTLMANNLTDFGVTDPGANVNDPETARKKAEQAAEEAKRKAEQEAADRQRWFEEIERQQRELMDARFAVLNAAAGDDPVKQARIAQAQAEYEMSKATSEAEKLNALASKISADRQMKDALAAVFDSQINLARAQADAIGDTVKSATISYFDAAVKLNDLLATDPTNEVAINNARAALVTAQASMNNSKIQKQLDDYSYLYDMEQITKDQYISYLEALRATLDPATQQDQFRDISRTIKQLQGDLAGDLQFNLPGSIDLPTLYEVRRTNQGTSGTGGSAIGYQDNRQIQVSMVITNGMTEQQAAEFLSGALGSNRTGYSFRRY